MGNANTEQGFSTFFHVLQNQHRRAIVTGIPQVRTLSRALTVVSSFTELYILQWGVLVSLIRGRCASLLRGVPRYYKVWENRNPQFRLFRIAASSTLS